MLLSYLVQVNGLRVLDFLDPSFLLRPFSITHVVPICLVAYTDHLSNVVTTKLHKKTSLDTVRSECKRYGYAAYYEIFYQLHPNCGP